MALTNRHHTGGIAKQYEKDHDYLFIMGGIHYILMMQKMSFTIWTGFLE